jgi:hypothetical protein
MTLQYFPEGEIIINNVSVRFGDLRSIVRDKLLRAYEVNDGTFKIGEQELTQRRDIYNANQNDNSFFFLGYDGKDCLSEIEVHKCEKISVQSVSFDFDTPLELVVSALQKISPLTSNASGACFFEMLKISLLSEKEMGGEGDNLGYFYCAEDVSHLK